jgi:hypothetical protein
LSERFKAFSLRARGRRPTSRFALRRELSPPPPRPARQLTGAHQQFGCHGSGRCLRQLGQRTTEPRHAPNWRTAHRRALLSTAPRPPFASTGSATPVGYTSQTADPAQGLLHFHARSCTPAWSVPRILDSSSRLTASTRSAGQDASYACPHGADKQDRYSLRHRVFPPRPPVTPRRAVPDRLCARGSSSFTGKAGNRYAAAARERVA